MTDTITNATVRTLTAEVRTLVVGSRQVTMSVYNQLDEVEWDELEPFGRVCPRGAWSYAIHVVGRSTRPTDTGALVRSWVPNDLAIDILRRGDSLPDGVPSLWSELTETERESIERALIAWEKLPLIVLAGLR